MVELPQLGVGLEVTTPPGPPAALLCVAQDSRHPAGRVHGFHSALFAPENQPEENGYADLPNQQLADLANSVGSLGRGCHLHRTGRTAAAAGAHGGIATLNQATGGRVGPRRWSRTAAGSNHGQG